MSAIIAAEAMHRLPRLRSYGPYPREHRASATSTSRTRTTWASWSRRDAFLYAGTTRARAAGPGALQRIAGYGSSSTVRYDGEGTYFLDKVRPGLWRLEVYPDAEPVRDPFEPPNPGKIVTRAISRSWPMTVYASRSHDLLHRAADHGGQPAGGTRPPAAAFRYPGGVRPQRVGSGGRQDASGDHRGTGIRRISRPATRLTAALGTTAHGTDVSQRARRRAARSYRRYATPPDSATLFIRPTAGGFYRRVRPAADHRLRVRRHCSWHRAPRRAASVRGDAFPGRFADDLPGRVCP